MKVPLSGEGTAWERAGRTYPPAMGPYLLLFTLRLLVGDMARWCGVVVCRLPMVPLAVFARMEAPGCAIAHLSQGVPKDANG